LEPATKLLDESFAPIPNFDKRFARQHRCRPPPEFPQTCCGSWYGQVTRECCPGFSMGRANLHPRRGNTPLSWEQEPSPLDRFVSMVPQTHQQEKITLYGGPPCRLQVRSEVTKLSPCDPGSECWPICLSPTRSGTQTEACELTDALHRAGPSVQGRLTHVQLLATWKPSPLWSSQVSCEYCYYNQDLH